jgi:hypothetical protein
MTDTIHTTVEAIEDIEAGDTLTIEHKGEVVADEVEVTQIKTCGFSGEPEPQTDGEIEFGSSLHDLLTEALGPNSQFADDFEVYTVEQDDAEDDESEPEVVADGGSDTEHSITTNVSRGDRVQGDVGFEGRHWGTVLDVLLGDGGADRAIVLWDEPHNRQTGARITSKRPAHYSTVLSAQEYRDQHGAFPDPRNASGKAADVHAHLREHEQLRFQSELATDGGEDTTDDLTDGEITESIERHDDPDHPDAATVEAVRDVLARINDDVLAHWDAHQDAIDDEALDIVYEDRDSIVLADRSGHFWNEQFDALDIDDDPLRTVIKSLHHARARARCDYSWSAVDPVVVRKTVGFRAGEQQVLREVARRTQEYGSVARAVDTLATETHGWSKSLWASLTGRNPSTVTRMTDNNSAPEENE